MNMRLVFLGFLSVILAFYLKTQANEFDLLIINQNETEQSQRVLHYVFSILMGLLGLCFFTWPGDHQQTLNRQFSHRLLRRYTLFCYSALLRLITSWVALWELAREIKKPILGLSYYRFE